LEQDEHETHSAGLLVGLLALRQRLDTWAFCGHFVVHGAQACCGLVSKESSPLHTTSTRMYWSS
jgi:hypothetical protein